MLIPVHDFIYVAWLDSFLITFPGPVIGMVNRNDLLEWARENTDKNYYISLVRGLAQGVEESLIIYTRRYRSLEDYIEQHIDELERLRREARRRGILVMFSGGKDSTALILLLERLGIEYTAVFSHLPIFEELLLEDSSSLIQEFAVKVISADKNSITNKLLSSRLPSKDDRWCTRLKHYIIKPMLKNTPMLRATGLRIYETGSRMRKYRHKRIIPSTDNVRRVNPIIYMTTSDVLNIVVRRGLLNTIYKYTTRASCMFCPFSSSVEIHLQLTEASRRVPEPYTIYLESVKRHMRRYGINDIPLTDYAHMGLWRYGSETARRIYRARERILDECPVKTLREWEASEIIYHSHIMAAEGLGGRLKEKLAKVIGLDDLRIVKAPGNY